MNAPASSPVTGCLTVRVASPLRSYTGGAASVALDAPDSDATLRTALDALERRYPGMRFRMVDEQDRLRTHIRMFADQRELRSLGDALGPATTLHLICALSGG